MVQETQESAKPQRRALERQVGDGRLTPGLGWFSLGLGSAEIAVPSFLARLIGVRERRALLRLLGVRELASGLGILTRRRPAPWLWSRVVGDVMDLTLLGLALRSSKTRKSQVALAAAAVAGVTALDLIGSRRQTRLLALARERARQELGIPPGASMAVNRSQEDCYRAWRDLASLPRFIEHLESVQVVAERRSHWVVRVPSGQRFEWDAELVEDEAAKVVAWRTLDGGFSGVVQFEPGPNGRGTLVRLSLHPNVESKALQELAGASPTREALRRFKQLIEVGEIATTQGQSSGRRSLKARALLKGPIS